MDRVSDAMLGAVFKTTPPDFRSAEVSGLRRQAGAEVTRSLDEAEAMSDWQRLDDATHDVCYEGERNWKIDDGYRYRCTLKSARVYAFSTDFKTAMLDFERQLLAAGWIVSGSVPSPPLGESANSAGQPTSDANSRPPVQYEFGAPRHASMADVLRDHYDRLQGPPLAELPPPSGYDRNGVHMDLAFADAATLTRDPIDLNFFGDQLSVVGSDWLYEEKELVDGAEVVARGTATHRHVLAVTVDRDYFSQR